MKRLLAFLLSMTAALGLAACGGTANNASSGAAGSAPSLQQPPASLLKVPEHRKKPFRQLPTGR